MIGLVLQGGGAKGGYQIGVWQALREMNIEIAAVTGTSVGALNGAFIAQNKFDRAYDVWYNMDPRIVISDDPDIYHQLVTKNYSIKNMNMYLDYFGKVAKQKGLDISPLRELIAGEVDEALLRSSKIDYGLVTVDLTNWKAIEVFIDEIEYGKVGEYMLASAFLPGFKPQMLDNKRFLDGGFYDNLPINLIRSRGYKEIVAVELGGVNITKNIKDKDLNIRRIYPSGDIGSILEFDKKRSRQNIKMGYLDTMKSYGRYEGNFYYLNEVPDELYFYTKLLQLRDSQIMSMAKIIGHEKGYPARLMTEVIIPDLCAILDFDIEMSYKDIMIGVVEYLAAAFEIDRLKVYTYEELLREVLKQSKENLVQGYNIEAIPAIIRKSSLLHRTFKAELLMEWLDIIAKQ